MLAQQAFYDAHVVDRTHEAHGDIIDILRQPELDIGAVDVRKVRHINRRVGQVDALAIGYHAVVLDSSHDVRRIDGIDGKLDEPVVDEHARALLDELRKIGIGYRHLRFVADDLARRERELRAAFKLDLAVTERLDAYLRTFRVQKYSERYAELLADALDHIDAHLVLVIGRVRKVEPRNVHSRARHCFEHGVIVGRRTERTNNLCSSHIDLRVKASARQTRAAEVHIDRTPKTTLSCVCRKASLGKRNN